MADDMIYRQAAIDSVSEACLELRGIFGRCEEALKALPSAEPKRKRGKWIVDKKRFGNTDRHCNLCGAILEGDDWKWRNNYYCYHCGTRMNLKGD